MIQDVSVIDQYQSDFEETARIAERANGVADQTFRGLLRWLLPNLRSDKEARIEGQKNKYQFFESLGSRVYRLLSKTDTWTSAVKRSRQLETNVEVERSKKSRRAWSLFDSLSFEDLLPFFFDYKLKGLEYVILKWAKHLPVEETQVVKYAIVSEPEPEIIRIKYRKVEEKEDDDKETKNCE